jgi:hypothetical protein
MEKIGVLVKKHLEVGVFPENYLAGGGISGRLSQARPMSRFIWLTLRRRRMNPLEVILPI